MGDVADMMLDGTLCEGCGVYLGGESFGVPRYCAGCQSDGAGISTDLPAATVAPVETHKTCRKCGKRVKWAGINDHLRDKHGITR